MLHRMDPIDEPRLIGVTEIATLRKAQADLETIFGFPSRRFEEEGMGELTGFAAETGSGVPFSLLALSKDGGSWAILAHSIGDLPAVLRELGMEEAALQWRAKKDPTRPWTVVRIDDAGNRTVMQRASSQPSAKRACDYWTARAGDHKQTWVVEKAA
jgi:hypothetical protein